MKVAMNAQMNPAESVHPLRRGSLRLTALNFMVFAALTIGASACSPEPVADKPDGSADAITSLDTGSHIGPGGLAILSLTPNRGPLSGGEEVDISGSEFFDDAKVFFGDEEVEVTFRGGSSHLFVQPPPHLIPGRVDVRVENPGVGSAVVKHGYTYLGHVQVDEATPLQGTHLGGTLVTVKGSGFVSGDRIVVGG